MKKYLRVLLFLFVIVSVRVEAVVVSTTFDTPVDHVFGQSTKMFTQAYTGNISTTVYKTINFKLPDNQTVSSQSTLNIGQSIVLSENTTSADWFITGYVNDSPPADNNLYIVSNGLHLGESVPVDHSQPIISSNNQSVLECNGLSCVARNPGSATITVSFPQKSNPSLYYRSLSPQYDFGFGSLFIDSFSVYYQEILDTVSRPYSFPSITYTVTVPPVPNTPQVSTCTGTANITKDSATVNWSYTDADNDPQTQYQVQLSTKSYSDPSFSTSTDVVFSSSSASNVTSHTFTGLTASTTYYSRVKTYNTTNGWSGFSSCAFGFTTSPDDVPPGSPICSCNGTRTLTCTTNGVATTTTPNSSSCAFNSYCSAATTTTTTTFTATSINGFGNITYSHGAISSTLPNTQQYSYPMPKVDGPQSLNINLLDSYDSKTSIAYCTVNNSITPITTTPTINILKSPRISLNKNSKCKLDWNIENMPEDTTCTLSGFSTGASTLLPLSFDPNITTSPTSWTSGLLQQNTKYTISCTDGASLSVSKSAICRVNPSVNEI